MCIIIGDAKVSDTLGYVEHQKDGKTLLIYENSIENLVDGDNAMILHLPCDKESVELLDSEPFKGFLKDLNKKYDDGTREKSLGRSLGMKSLVRVIENDVYKVSLVKASDIRFSNLEMQEELISFYEETLPDFTVLIAEFKGSGEKEQFPIVVRYSPVIVTMDKMSAIGKKALFFPMLDNEVDGVHNGSRPVLDEVVERSHTIYVGLSDAELDATGMRRGFFSRRNAEIKGINFPKKIEAKAFDKFDFNGWKSNGDFFYLGIKGSAPRGVISFDGDLKKLAEDSNAVRNLDINGKV